MSIIDNTGKKIQVTNLSAAIAQANTYQNYSDPQNKEMSATLKTYWTDIYNKLIKL